jgi:hypothetical protein
MKQSKSTLCGYGYQKLTNVILQYAVTYNEADGYCIVADVVDGEVELDLGQDFTSSGYHVLSLPGPTLEDAKEQAVKFLKVQLKW